MLLRALVLLLALLLTVPATAQQSTMATDYWCSFLPSVDNKAPAWLLVTTNTPGTQVKVTYMDDPTQVDQFAIEPNKPMEYRIRMHTRSDNKYMMAKPDKPDTAQRRSIYIEASHPVILQQFSDGDNNVGLAMPIPTAFLGREYVIAAFNDQHPVKENGGGFGGWEPDTLPRTSGSFIIIAVEDSTVVQVLANAKFTGGLNKGQTRHVKLNKGETYLMKGLADSSANDISGSRVSSNKPIAVTAGCEVARTLDALVLQDHFDYNDYIADYMLPVEQWGTEYIGTPLTNKRGTKEDDLWGEFYRVFAEDSTELFVNGQSRGISDNWEFKLVTTPMEFKAEKPIMVVQYDYYIDFHGINPKNPRTSNSMMVLTPRHQWVKNATFTIPTGYEETYFYVTAHKDSIDKVRVSLNGGATWNPIAGMKFSLAQTYNLDNYRTYTLVLGRRGQVTFDGPCQFQVYNHGTRDNDFIKATYGYASTVASTFGRLQSSDLAVKLDSTCSEFELSVTDPNLDGPGIADVILLEYGQKYHGTSYSSENTRLSIDPYPIGSKTLMGRIDIKDPFKPAVAYLQIRSRSGWDTLVTVGFEALRMQAQPLVRFADARFGEKSCKTSSITNIGSKAVTIDTLLLFRDTSSFSLSFSQPFPQTIEPGSELEFDVCYSATDTSLLDWDSVVVVTGCVSPAISRVDGTARVARIFAQDHDYDVVHVGQTEAYDIEVENQSPYLPLTLIGAELASDEFFIDSLELARFPLELATYSRPGYKTRIRVIYTPTDVGRDSARIIWKTDIPSPYTENNRKGWSILIGRGESPKSVHAKNATPSISVFNGTLHLKLSEGETLKDLKIVDLLGIRYEPRTADLSIEHLPHGVYIVQISTNQRDLQAKIVK